MSLPLKYSTSGGPIRPAIVPFDGNVALVKEHLLSLKSLDSNARVNAFNHLRAIPKSLLREQWGRVRWQQPPEGWDNECLHRLHVEKPSTALQGKRAFVTVISRGYEPMLRALLDSLALHGRCPDVPFIVFCVGDEVYDALNGWNVIRIRCHAHGRISAAVKGAIYSCTRWLDFESIVALEADMLIVDDLSHLFEAVEHGHKRNIYGCRSQGVEDIHRLREVLGHMDAPESDLEWLTNRPNLDPMFHFNGGVLAGSWSAWKALDAGIEALNPFVSMWVEGSFHRTFGDEFAMNLVLSLSPQTLAASELSPVWNAQIIDKNISHWIQETPTPAGLQITRLGEKARIVHFITEKPRIFKALQRLRPPQTAYAQSPHPSRLHSSIKCRQCNITKTCSSCFEPTTFARERLASGARSAICRVCFARAQNQTEAQIDEDLKEIAFELKMEQNK